MPIRRLLPLALALFATSANAAPATPPPLSLPTNVSGGAVAPDGTMWFSGWTEGVSFFLPPGGAIDGDSLFQALKGSSDAGRWVTVTFDPASGQFDRARGRIAYRICAVKTETALFGQASLACPATGAAASFGTAIAPALSLGVADSAAYRAASISELDAALGDAGLDPVLRAIGLRARSEAHALAALKDHKAADTHLVAALHDATAWAALAPEDHEAWLQAAQQLIDLGAYDQAIRSYQAIAAHWADENYRAAVRIGAIYRIEGRNEDALAALDRLVATAGPQPGMKFHYHRGWTLTLLGRYDAAIRDLSEGLAAQPDYQWAYMRRACANAAIGNIKNAAADQRLGANKLAAVMSTETEPLDTELADATHANAVADQLDALAKKGSVVPTKVACEGYSEDAHKRRRSALLTDADIAAATLKS